jgi:hypothetical protein
MARGGGDDEVAGGATFAKQNSRTHDFGSGLGKKGGVTRPPVVDFRSWMIRQNWGIHRLGLLLTADGCAVRSLTRKQSEMDGLVGRSWRSSLPYIYIFLFNFDDKAMMVFQASQHTPGVAVTPPGDVKLDAQHPALSPPREANVTPSHRVSVNSGCT